MQEKLNSSIAQEDLSFEEEVELAQAKLSILAKDQEKAEQNLEETTKNDKSRRV